MITNITNVVVLMCSVLRQFSIVFKTILQKNTILRIVDRSRLSRVVRRQTSRNHGRKQDQKAAFARNTIF